MEWIKWISEMQAIAQTGLEYTENVYDRERYEQLITLAAKITAQYTEHDMEQIKNIFAQETGYATPKIDVRAVIIEGNQILLAQESSDGLWSLPGGWADVNHSAGESVLKEIKEETGCQAEIIRLLAFWDKQKHDYPPQWPHTYKCFFQCKLLDRNFDPNHEIIAVKFFPLDQLPDMSVNRVTASQIIKLKKIVDLNLATAFD